MKTLIVRPAARALSGQIAVPGDKSIGHRALLFGALAGGQVTICGLSGGQDNARSAAAAAALGASVERGADRVVVTGRGLDGLRPPAAPIDCGNSGTTIRLLSGLLAGQPFPAEMFGDESLSGRPMRRVIDPLTRMGARIDGASGARPGEVYPPLRVQGVPPGQRLRGTIHEMAVASAQVKSALILAGLYADGVTEIIESAPTRDHTERMLQYLGVPLRVEPADAGRRRICIDPRGWNRQVEARPFTVPGDPSSAAFIVAAALVAGADQVTVSGVCTNPTRTGFLEALAGMGAAVQQVAPAEQGEPTADLLVRDARRGALRGTLVAGDTTVRAIDELPVLAVVAACAAGATEFRDAGELRVKESDRIATTCAMLRGLGVEVEEFPDGFRVEGRAGQPLRACRVDACGDHRIAMSAAVAALAADGPVRIDDAANVATSFPTFPAVLSELGADLTVE
jgi:3-phosphoshikimate 1-carboxyvinyltransferase